MIALLLLACSSLSGTWSGDVDCGSFGMSAEIQLERDGDSWTGTGTMDCTDYVGVDCLQTYDVEVQKDERDKGDWVLDVNNSDCVIEIQGSRDQAACTDPDEVLWDGGDSITGEWDVCDFELQRD